MTKSNVRKEPIFFHKKEESGTKASKMISAAHRNSDTVERIDLTKKVPYPTQERIYNENNRPRRRTEKERVIGYIDKLQQKQEMLYEQVKVIDDELEMFRRMIVKRQGD
jgi:hypothetical protein